MSEFPSPVRAPSAPPVPTANAAQAASAASAALAGEHAAIYAFGVVGAHFEDSQQPLAAAALSRHLAQREALTATIAGGGLGVAEPAEPAYALPFPVRYRADALRLAVLVEDRLAALYLRLVTATADRQLRALAASALQASAADAARWRLRAGAAAITVAFPGR